MRDICLSRERKIFLLTVLILAILSISFKFLLIDRQRITLTNNLQTITEKKQTISEVKNFYKNHQDVAKYEAELNKRQYLVDKMLPDKLSPGDFFLELQRQAYDTGVVLLNIKPGNIKKEKQYLTQEIIIGFQADYFQLNDFWQCLEQEERFVKIQAVKVKSRNDGMIIEGEANLLIFALSE